MPESNDHDGPQLPSEIETSSAGAHLGNPVATYPWRMPPIPWRGYAMWGTLTVILCGTWGYLAGAAVGAVWAALLFLMLGIPLVLRRRSRFIDINAQLALYEHGLVVVGANGTIRVARYDSTLAYLYGYSDDTFQREADRPKYYTGTLTDIAGQSIPLNGFFETDFWLRGGYTDPQYWASTIHDGIVKACFASAAAELDAGGALDFGPIRISATDISANGQAVPWPSVQEISVDAGRVGITVDGKWKPLKGAALELIPNFRLFTALTDHRRHQAKPDEQEPHNNGEPQTD
ncbi:DUF6585 family protein [Nocardia sp. NPDC004604]|uniref:DUF6585 family protein n=1 Tax=Nocardia sp. NPDC004604 TaxID=3157013 RepID=UPI0033BBBF5B